MFTEVLVSLCHSGWGSLSPNGPTPFGLNSPGPIPICSATTWSNNQWVLQPRRRVVTLASFTSSGRLHLAFFWSDVILSLIKIGWIEIARQLDENDSSPSGKWTKLAYWRWSQWNTAPLLQELVHEGLDPAAIHHSQWSVCKGGKNSKGSASESIFLSLLNENGIVPLRKVSL